ncbi:MAG: transporter substrate-binding domain-containing protein [Alphaproteobacteria bacterium]|nr:transporter substrate-binding domain-containing protein [Alphaproteobacteria bacterium]
MTLQTVHRLFLVLILLLLPGTMSAVHGQQPVAIPNYWDPRERVILPDLTPRTRIRFLTTADFPPFNFIDQRDRVAGFHVDLARAICSELAIVEKCQLQVLPWNELTSAITSGQGDAIIAGLAVNSDNRKQFLFTRPFLKLPARFIRLKTTSLPTQDSQALAQRRVGVLAKSAHEALLRTYFPDIKPVTYGTADFMFDGLKTGEVDAVFGDGVQLSFWLGSNRADDCCIFFDGPYFAPAFLGEGLSVAVRNDSPDLVQAFDHALQALSKNGRLKELYLRYFPNGLY